MGQGREETKTEDFIIEASMPTRPCPMPMRYWGIWGGVETKLQFQLKVESLWKVLISLWKQNLNWYFSHFQWSWSLANCELLSLLSFRTIQWLDSQIIADQLFIMSWQLIIWIGGGAYIAPAFILWPGIAKHGRWDLVTWQLWFDIEHNSRLVEQ